MHIYSMRIDIGHDGIQIVPAEDCTRGLIYVSMIHMYISLYSRLI